MVVAQNEFGSSPVSALSNVVVPAAHTSGAWLASSLDSLLLVAPIAAAVLA